MAETGNNQLKFDFGGESLIASIDPKTRKWSLQGHVLDSQAEKVVMDLLAGPNSRDGIPPRSPADGVAWMADMKEAAERVDGTYELPDIEPSDDDVLY